MKYAICLVLFASLLGIAPAQAMTDAEKDAIRLEKYLKIHSKEFRERNKHMAYYGVVQDFEGAPVADAEVLLEITSVPENPFHEDKDRFRRTTRRTGPNGVFVIDDVNGHTIKMIDIRKEGYDYQTKHNRNWMVDLEYDKNKLDYGNLKKKPVPYRVRKLSPPSFMFTYGMGLGLKPGEERSLDLIRKQWLEPYQVPAILLTDKDWHPDIRASVDREGENYRLVIEALDPDSGFAVVENVEFFEQLVEAPEHGYRPKLVFTVRPDSGGKIFAYVKAQGGLFYGNMYLSYLKNSRSDKVGLELGYRINVTGERGTEYSSALYNQYLDDVRNGKRPQLRRGVLERGEPVEIPVPEPAQ